MLPKVSIVIPGYNCSKTIGQTIVACLNQNYPKDLVEVIFVDDGSIDDTKNIVRKFPVKYIRQENSGPARARNRGWREAGGELILFTDADCRPDEDWIFSLVKNFEDSGITAVGGSYGISNPQNFLASCIHAEILWRHKKMSSEVKALGSYNLALPKKVLQELGGFDETYLTASGEDNDLCYRIIKKGYKLVFAPQTLVYHRHPERLFPYLKHQFRHGFWRVKLYRDHPRMTGGDDYSNLMDYLLPLIAVFLLLALPFLGIKQINKIWIWGILFLLLIEISRTFMILRIPLKLEHIYMSVMLFLRDFWRGLGMLLGFIRFFILRAR